MRSISWDYYYENYVMYEDSTKIKNAGYLSDVGDSYEVSEIICDLQTISLSAANKLLKKAVEAKSEFTCDEICSFDQDLDASLLEEALLNSIPKLNGGDMEELASLFDEDTVLKVCKMGNFPLPEDLKYLEEDEEDEPICEDFREDDIIEKKTRTPGLFKCLFGAAGIIGFFDYIGDKFKKDDK